MFKKATWTRRNRNLFDIVDRLGDRALVPLEMEIETAETSADLAFSPVRETGYQLLIRSIVSAIGTATIVAVMVTILAVASASCAGVSVLRHTHPGRAVDVPPQAE